MCVSVSAYRHFVVAKLSLKHFIRCMGKILFTTINAYHFHYKIIEEGHLKENICIISLQIERAVRVCALHLCKDFSVSHAQIMILIVSSICNAAKQQTIFYIQLHGFVHIVLVHIIILVKRIAKEIVCKTMSSHCITTRLNCIDMHCSFGSMTLTHSYTHTYTHTTNKYTRVTTYVSGLWYY